MTDSITIDTYRGWDLFVSNPEFTSFGAWRRDRSSDHIGHLCGAWSNWGSARRALKAAIDLLEPTLPLFEGTEMTVLEEYRGWNLTRSGSRQYEAHRVADGPGLRSIAGLWDSPAEGLEQLRLAIDEAYPPLALFPEEAT